MSRPKKPYQKHPFYLHLKHIANLTGLASLKRWMFKNYRLLSLAVPLLMDQRPFVGDPSTNLIISITSFPGRITRTWIAIEHILRQDVRPWKVILVLAEDEFSDRKLPWMIRRQTARGLEILWISESARSYNKLLPVRSAYPSATIVTFDDDQVYEPWRVRLLLEAAQERPGVIIGHRGWEVGTRNGAIRAYETWKPAGPHTDSRRCFLTGVGGILYPPDVLPISLLCDLKIALELTPLGDDIWFWAVAQVSGASLHCLGNGSARGIPQHSGTPALSHRNWGEGLNNKQLQAVCQHFGLQALVPDLRT
jgi:hypothetical protein